MSEAEDQLLILCLSVNHVMWAAKILKNKGISCKVVPIPKDLSPDCGVCLKISTGDRDAVQRALDGSVEYSIRGSGCQKKGEIDAH